MANCFECNGRNPPEECLKNMIYHQGEHGDCDNYNLARKEWNRFNSRQQGKIGFPVMLAQYLSRIGRTDDAVKILRNNESMERIL